MIYSPWWIQSRRQLNFFLIIIQSSSQSNLPSPNPELPGQNTLTTYSSTTLPNYSQHLKTEKFYPQLFPAKNNISHRFALLSVCDNKFTTIFFKSSIDPHDNRGIMSSLTITLVTKFFILFAKSKERIAGGANA